MVKYFQVLAEYEMLYHIRGSPLLDYPYAFLRSLELLLRLLRRRNLEVFVGSSERGHGYLLI